MRRLEGLDGLRGGAALAVLAYHVAIRGGLTMYGPLAPVLAELKAGVAVFFVISGCVLWLPFARALADGRPLPHPGHYARRRAVRILPAYWIALSVLALLPWDPVLGHDAWRYYTLTQIYDPSTVIAGLGPAWSLCVEVSFYAVVPLLALAARRVLGARLSAKAQLLGLAGIAVGSAGWRVAWSGGPFASMPHDSVVVMTALPGCADWFALGMGIAVLASRQATEGGPSRAVGWLLGRRALVRIAAAGLALDAALTARGDVFLPLVGPVAHVEVGVAAALVVLMVALRPGPDTQTVLPARTLAWRKLGEMSYGIYLWNVIVLALIAGPGTPFSAAPIGRVLALLILTTSGTLVCAALSWYGLERPLLRAGARSRALLAPGRA